MFKKHMVPLSAKGKTVAHAGKGSEATGMPDRSQLSQLGAPGATLNDYAKASPASEPAGNPAPPMGGYGLGG